MRISFSIEYQLPRPRFPTSRLPMASTSSFPPEPFFDSALASSELELELEVESCLAVSCLPGSCLGLSDVVLSSTAKAAGANSRAQNRNLATKAFERVFMTYLRTNYM